MHDNSISYSLLVLLMSNIITLHILLHSSREIDGETVETVSDFILGGSKITVDGD